MKIVLAYTIDNCRWCPHSSGLETHSEDFAACNHKKFDECPDGKSFEDTTGDIPSWCPLEDA